MTAPEIYISIIILAPMFLAGVVYLHLCLHQKDAVLAGSFILAVVLIIVCLCACQDSFLVRAYERQTGIAPEIVAGNELVFERGKR